MKRLRILTCCTVIVASLIFFLKQRTPMTIAMGEGLVVNKDWLKVNPHPITPLKDVRPADQTFLTFPEWYLVFSPEEQANYFKHTTASSFPFNAHTRQIWGSYAIVKDQIRDNFPVNKGYHFMIWVIGSSATVEYSIKSVYEKLVGRLSDTHEVQTDEDRFNASFTQDYVDFIKDRPWYEFDFKSQLRALYSSTSVFGEHTFRKLERRYILTSELLVKWAYGKLIGLGTQQIYDAAGSTTAVVLGDRGLIYLPRYDKFAGAIDSLARTGRGIVEVAGNTSAILLTVLVPQNSPEHFDGAETVFVQPLSSEPSRKRVAIAVKVGGLEMLLRKSLPGNAKLEHVFDF